MFQSNMAIKQVGVCGHTDKAYEQFSRTVEFQPADNIARQLRDLMKDSLPDEGDTGIRDSTPIGGNRKVGGRGGLTAPAFLCLSPTRL